MYCSVQCSTVECIELAQASVECILSAAVTGLIYALFSGQPLTLLSATGPVFVFEQMLYAIW